MIKILIVDDEPFIRQGLQILIPWEQYGFEIAGEASNGKEAIELLNKQEFDLVFTDIKMPEMDGLELIEYTWNSISREPRFVILSGYSDFEYAKKAIKFNVADYVLKPVQKEELVRVLEDYKEQYMKQVESQKKLEFSEKAVFDRHLTNLITGKFNEESYHYTIEYLLDAPTLRYISIEFDIHEEDFYIQNMDEKLKAQRILYDKLKGILGKNWYHAYYNTLGNENEYSVGLIYVKKLAELMNLSEKGYIGYLHKELSKALSYKIIFCIGQKVDSINQISESYKSATIAKTFQRFVKEKDIAYYDEIIDRIQTNKNPLNKDLMNELIKYIEENEAEAIETCIDKIYMSFRDLVTEPQIIKINLDYLLYNLINLVKEMDPDFDQDEIYKLISQGGFEQIAVRGSAKHFKKFALEFSNYLSQLRQHALGGVLTEIEKEITENYMDNLSLKSLSEKYYINSAYLGQIFKKQYGVPFKDYLNSYRLDRAAELLLRTDEKIYHIAAAVGFNNTDYFISKFVQIKGITPLQYRKQFLKK